MDIDDIRRANIRTLETEAGSATSAADRLGMSYSQYLNYRNGAKEAKTGKLRGMRKETAWRFEDAFGKPRGWLDIHPDPNQLNATAAPYVVRPVLAPLVRQVCDLAEQIDDNGLRELIGFARCLTGTHPRVKAKHRSSA